MRIGRVLQLAICLPALVAVAGGARQSTGGSPFVGPLVRLSPAVPEGSAQPNLAAGRDGRVWLSWLEADPSAGHRFRISAFDGRAWSDPITLAEGRSLLANWADFPSVFVAADGTLAAHWLERGAGREAYSVRVRTSGDGGRAWSAPVTPHGDQSATEHGFVSFFDAPGGGVGLIWLDGRALAAGHTMDAAMSLRATTLNAEGAETDTLVDARVCDCCQTSAARAGDAVLVAYRDRSDKEIRDTSIVRLTTSGWSQPAKVHADGWEITACPVNGPVVAAAGNDAAVVWFTGAGGAVQTRLAFSRDAGRTFSRPIALDSGETMGRLDMVLPSPGRALVASLERTEPGARLVLKDVRADGRPIERVEIAPATRDRSGGFARMALAGGRLFVTWTEVRSGGAPSQVRVASMEVR